MSVLILAFLAVVMAAYDCRFTVRHMAKYGIDKELNPFVRELAVRLSPLTSVLSLIFVPTAAFALASILNGWGKSIAFLAGARIVIFAAQLTRAKLEGI